MNLVTAAASWQPLDGLAATSDVALATNFLYVRGPDNTVYAHRRDRVVGYERVDGEATGNPAAFATALNGGPHDQTRLARLTSGALASNSRPYVNGQPASQFGGYTTIAGALSTDSSIGGRGSLWPRVTPSSSPRHVVNYSAPRTGAA